MVDFKSYYDYQSPKAPLLGELRRYDGRLECSCGECRQKFQELYKFDWDKHSRNKALDVWQCLLCPPRVLGYALEQKRWVQLHLEKLENPGEGDRTSFNKKLQLKLEYKDV